MLTFQDLYRQWQKEHKPRLKPHTQKLQENQWETYILPHLGNHRLVTIDRQPIYELFAEISEEAPIMANRVLSLISTALSLAEAWQWRQPGSNPCKTIRKNKENKRKRYLTPAEFERLGMVLYAWEKRGAWWTRASRFISLIMLTAARKNEIAKVKRSWVDFESKTLRLPDSKTGEKGIALPTGAIKLIRRMIEEEPKSEWLCLGASPDKPLENPYHTWHKILEEAGIEDFHIHDLRHTFASVGLSFNKYNLKQIGGVLGHASVQSSNRYTHLMPAQHNELSETIAGTIEGLLFPIIGAKIPTQTGISSIMG
jgi:integrase